MPEDSSKNFTIDVQHSDKGKSVRVLADGCVDLVHQPVEQACIHHLCQGVFVVCRSSHIERAHYGTCTLASLHACLCRMQSTQHCSTSPEIALETGHKMTAQDLMISTESCQHALKMTLNGEVKAGGTISCVPSAGCKRLHQAGRLNTKELGSCAQVCLGITSRHHRRLLRALAKSYVSQMQDSRDRSKNGALLLLGDSYQCHRPPRFLSITFRSFQHFAKAARFLSGQPQSHI